VEAQSRSLPLSAWLTYGNTDDHTTHDVTQLEVFAHGMRWVFHPYLAYGCVAMAVQFLAEVFLPWLDPRTTHHL